MKIFDEYSTREAANEDVCFLSGDCSKYDARDAFIHGVEYVESKVKDLCIEFAEYYYDNCDENGNYEYQFEQFLNERKCSK